jgi:hypothetical protein
MREKEVCISAEDLSQISRGTKEQANDILKVWVEEYNHAPVENVIFVLEDSTNSAYLKSVAWKKPLNEYQRNELCYWQSIRRFLMRRLPKGKWVVIQDQSLPSISFDTKQESIESASNLFDYFYINYKVKMVLFVTRKTGDTQNPSYGTHLRDH